MRPGEGVRDGSLDGLRGAAAFTVLVYHWALCLRGSDFPWAQAFVGRFWPLKILADGQTAVALFFILSGYVLFLPYLAGTHSRYGAFVIRRICRIWLPAAAAVICAALVEKYLAGDASPSTPWLGETWRPPTLGSLLSALRMTGSDYSVDPPLWSLAVELQVALIFPLLARMSARGGSVLLALACTLAAYPLQRLFRAGDGPVLTEAAGTLRFLFLFAWGIALAEHRLAVERFIRSHAGAWIGGWAVAVLLLASRFCPWPIPERLWAPYLGAMLLFPLLLGSAGISGLLRSRPFQYLGRVSFSLYLVHFPILVVAFRHAAGALTLLAFPAALACASLFRKAIEAPANRLGHRLAPSPPERRFQRVGAGLGRRLGAES